MRQHSFDDLALLYAFPHRFFSPTIAACGLGVDTSASGQATAAPAIIHSPSPLRFFFLLVT
jgi:hypothetical protein